MTLEARLRRIEDMEGKMFPQQQYRFHRLAASNEEESAIRNDIVAQGYNPDIDLFLIKLVPLEASEAVQ